MYLIFDIGDLFTGKFHDNDTVFVITDIVDDICYLRGMNVRLIADSFIDDLNKYNDDDVEEMDSFLERIKNHGSLDRTDYFYLPGKILHIDADNQLINNPENPCKIRVNFKLRKSEKTKKIKKMAFFLKI